MNRTCKVFSREVNGLILLGGLAGLLFPVLLSILGTLSREAFRPSLFITSFLAGSALSFVVALIARKLMGRRISRLAERMQYVETHLNDLVSSTKSKEKETNHRFLADSSAQDEIGKCSSAYNSLLNTLAFTLRIDAAMGSFTEILTRRLETTSISEHALERFMDLSGACAGAIILDQDGELVVTASYGLSSPDVLKESDHVRKVFQVGREELVTIPEDVTVQGVIADFRPSAIALEPIIYKDEVLGVVILASTEDFDIAVRKHLSLFMQVLGLALNNALAHDRMQKIAALDPLTGIYNRRFGLKRLHEEFGRTVRSGIPLGLVMMDIDHFKKINDEWGHLTGDRVLKSLVGVARSAFREGDIMLRYGGEEFLLILPASNGENSGYVAERIRRVVEDFRLHTGEGEISITVSLGATSFPEYETENETELIEVADRALYRAKQNGRNRVVTDY